MVSHAEVLGDVSCEALQSADDSLAGMFDDGLALLAAVVERAASREERWLDRVRSGLVELLGFLDDNPGWGSVLIAEEPPLGAPAPRRGQRPQDVLVRLLDHGRSEAIDSRELTRPPTLTAELVVGGVLSVIRARIDEPERGCGPLVELAPSLMSFIALAYLGQAAASAELAADYVLAPQAPPPAPKALATSPIPVTRRTTLVLHAIASAPRSSNREIAAAAGLADEGQTSHLLHRLAQRGLIEKVPPRSGSRRENAWLLTPRGWGVLDLLADATPARARRAAAAQPITEVAL